MQSVNRPSVCNVDLNDEGSDNRVIQMHNKPLKTLEDLLYREGKSNRRAATWFTRIHISLTISLLILNAVSTLLNAISIYVPESSISISTSVISGTAFIMSSILHKWDVGKFAGQHVEKFKAYNRLRRKLKITKYTTPFEEWGNLYLQIYNDYETIEERSKTYVPEFLSSRTLPDQSESAVETILPVLNRNQSDLGSLVQSRRSSIDSDVQNQAEP